MMLQSRQVLSQGCSRSKHSQRCSLQHWIAVCQFADAVFIPASRDGTNFQPEVPQEPTHGLSGPKQGTDLLRRNGFTVNRTEPTEMKCRAMPSASRRSVLIGMVFRAPFTYRVSIGTASSLASVSLRCSHCDKGPASSPMTATVPS